MSTLARGAFAAGEHVISWSPVTQGLAPGAYFLRLESPDAASGQKLMISR